MTRRAMKRLVGVGVAAALAAVAGESRATLTASETEQVRQWIASAQPANAQRVRALVARPDLSSDEAAAALSGAMTTLPLDDGRAAFVREVVFGGASTASRPVLAPAAVKALMARADALYAQHAFDLDRSAAPLAELSRAYALVDEIASADASANVTDSARDACTRALADHAARNAATLRPDAPVTESVARVRAQAAIALYDLTADSATRRVDAADRIGLTGSRRAALVDAGVLILDAGGLDAAAHVDAIRALADRTPGARDGVEAILIFVGVDARGLRARGGAVVPVADVPDAPLSPATSPWGADADPPPGVRTTDVAIARALASAAVRRAMDRRPELRAVTERDGGEAGVANAATMLVIDAPRTLSAAGARFLAGHPEAASRVADALGALAAFGNAGDAKEGLAMTLGRARAGGGTEAARVTHVSLAPSGVATAFQIDHHLWRIAPDESGALSVRRDGAPVTADALPNGRIPVDGGPAWTLGGVKLARLAGRPFAGVDGARIRVVSGSGSDAIGTKAPGDDVVVEADVTVHDGPAGIVVRATLPRTYLRAAWVAVTPDGHAQIVTSDGAGLEKQEADVVIPGGAPTQHVRVVVKGASLEATVGSAALGATLPPFLAHGDVGFRVAPGASLEASGFVANRP